MAEPVRRPRTRYRSETLRPTEVVMLEVRSVDRSRESLVRVVLPAPRGWTSTGFDDVVVLCFADPESGEVALPVPGPGGALAAPDRGRLLAREYTVVRLDEELVLDLVLHETGPGAGWARAVRPGDRVGVVGPRLVRGVPSADRILAVGDATAWPAMSRLLRDWPRGATGEVVALLPSELMPTDPTAMLPEGLTDGLPDGVRLHHLAASGDSGRDVRAVIGLLEHQGWAGADGFAWIAGESALATGVRRWLVSERSMDRDQVQFTGYWRRGHTADEHT